MHFIIANVPEGFRSPDLRNFFSEFIEKEGFRCFHFRHRPQTHLVNILKNSSNSALTKDAVATNKFETEPCDGCHDSESIKRREINEKKTPPFTTTELGGEGEGSDSNDRTPTAGKTGTDHNTSDVKSSGGKDRLSERTEAVESESNTEREDGRKDNADSQKHWLSSGLAGLASLISEKKRQVRPSDRWSQDKKEISRTKGIHNVTKDGDISEGRNTTIKQSSSSSVDVLSLVQNEKTSKRTCCVVDVKERLEETFIKKYDRKHWLNRSGDILPHRCYLLRVDFSGDSSKGTADEDYKTRQELSALSLASDSPQDLIEFRPPPIMPQGNVGTPTQHFRELIRTCQMPGTLIKKLGLEFTRGKRKRRFGQVPFDYGTDVVFSQDDNKDQKETHIAFTATGHLIPTSADFEKQQKMRKKKGSLPKGPRMELEKEGEDGAEVEEWERYEPFHEDVTSQDRIKERRYEEELEVVWEKGGPGLVFYTDAQYWRAQQGDFDEQTADEWDVDMSVYYEEGGGDKDARDGVDMTISDKLRSGSLAQSVFAKRKEISGKQNKGKGMRKIGPTRPPPIGKFEAHTRGFGRRMMEAQGWQEGQGLGVGSAGMPYALDNDGQHPHDRKGFGYHGEKLQGWSSTSSTTKSTHRHHRISTIFDKAEDADPPPPTLRTPEPTALTHRR